MISVTCISTAKDQERLLPVDMKMTFLKLRKKRRLAEIVALQNKLSRKSNNNDIGKTFKVLIEGNSKKSENDWMGRSSENKVVVFSKDGIADKGDYVNVVVTSSTGGTLLGRVIR